MRNTDIVVLGGGPAGLAAAVSARQAGADVLLIERETRLGGILKQCIHDGFGIVKFGERLTGPEYSERYCKMFHDLEIPYLLSSFLVDVTKEKEGFQLLIQNESGIEELHCNALILACGCRERTSRQVMIHGDRPAGIYSAGTAQYFVNIMGYLPTKRCVILGSGDIGLIMARRLTLEGASVEGVYEINPAPSGLARNISQCLDDYNIPLHLSSTVTKVFGDERVEGVEVCQVENMKPIPGTERQIPCDALILSVGLIPENEIAEQLGAPIDNATKGPLADQSLMTGIPGVFSCGNALHVNDLVDYVSQSGETAGVAAAAFVNHPAPIKKTGNRFDADKAQFAPILYDKKEFAYVVPQYIDRKASGKITLYFRSRSDVSGKRVSFEADGTVLKTKKYQRLLPSEMEVVTLDITEQIGNLESVTVRME